VTDRITLFELNQRVKINLKDSFPGTFWVVAEINNLQINTAGHCYLELIEKDSKNDLIVAKSRATIWAFTFRILKPYFETTAGQPLASGMKVLIKVQVEFHELYGYSLNVKDIDPSYTLGDLARQRKETIRKLREEGIFEMNRETDFPLLPQKIAVISSPSAAGYQDFLEELNNNPYNYKFYPKLFPSIMQGSNMVNSIISSLDRIFKLESFFDVVVIIRGGGSQTDLSFFDNYNLASNIAQFPIPILTGIGHDRDESVADLVAYLSLKTPTAAAGFLVDSVLEVDNQTRNVYDRIILNARETTHIGIQNLNKKVQTLAPVTQKVLNNQNYYISQLAGNLKENCSLLFQQKNADLSLYFFKSEFLSRNIFTKSSYILKDISSKFKNILFGIFEHHTHKMSLLQRSFDLLNPERILQRGYSLTSANGKILKHVIGLEKSQTIKTQLYQGTIESKIEKIKLER